MGHSHAPAGLAHLLEVATQLVARPLVRIHAAHPVGRKDRERLWRQVNQLSELRLPAADLPSHELMLGHVHGRPKVAIDDAVFVNLGSDGPKEKHLTVVSENAAGMIDAPAFRTYPLDDPVNVFAIIWMHVGEDVRQRDLSVARIAPEHAEDLLRPFYLARQQIERPRPRAAQLLALNEVRFAALQVGVESRVFE